MADWKPKPILELTRELGIADDQVALHGPHMAKLALDLLKAPKKPAGKLIVVTGMTPPPSGVGKTVTTISLAMGLKRIGVSSIACLRQPSLGPVFGIKGGGAGGSKATLLPVDDINHHFTGDIHAVQAAHNLGAAFLDNHIFHGNKLGIDPAAISLRRSLDMNDRALRKIQHDAGGRADGFDITAASEVMSILAMSSDYVDLRKRLGRIVVGATKDKKPVMTEDFKAAGPMALLVRNALRPNIVQTCENTPALVHIGPFGNLSIGTNSILADRLGLRLADYAVTEAGFAADLGFEKFIDIVCRTAGFAPSAAVIVATVNAMKAQSTGGNLDGGVANLGKAIEIVRGAGIPAVVALNRFPTDSDAEIQKVRETAEANGAAFAINEGFGKGGAGAEDLAKAVVLASKKPSSMKPTYELNTSLTSKIEAIATRIYGADGVDINDASRAKLDQLTEWGFGGLPLCMAKTHLSISHDAELKGRPSGFRLPVKNVALAAGAGYVTIYCGPIISMPGLPDSPAGEHLDIDANGNPIIV